MAWAILLARAEAGERLRDVVDDLSFGAAMYGLVRNPASLILSVLVIAGLVGFAKVPPKGSNRYRLAGAVLGVLLILLTVGAVCLASQAAARFGGRLAVLVFLLVPTVVGGVAASFLFGIYLFVTNKAFRMHDNEAFSAIHHPHYKHFLRLHLDRTGITVYAIGLEHVGKHWRPRAAATSTDPPCEQAEKVRPQLITQFTVPAPMPVGGGRLD